ncbi:EAL domain-containing protein [Psychromonas sp. KJ10-10]|uniref:EAL domain-containing protein n=1 Tax=Psychromonas sp. KJ10-10 TaxID=3391823 RepID=UPI0039B68397
MNGLSTKRCDNLISGKKDINLGISVNISSNHLLSPSFVEDLECHLAEYSANHAKNLQLEILESSAFGDINTLHHIVEICQNRLGVSFALDDFGTGYSSLTHLRRLSVNTIKIDQSFVRDMLDDPNDYTIIEGVITLTKLFKRSVIAEGVESQDHGLMLLLMGCEQAQGYQIAKPMPEKDFIIWLNNYTANKAWLSCAKKQGSNNEVRLDIFRMINEKWIEKFKSKLASQPEERKPWPILDPLFCQCGNWIDREKQEQHFKQEDLKQLEQAHDKLHDIADVIHKNYQQGDLVEARADLGRLEGIVQQVQKIEKACR